jgi:hypothetical protein
MTTQIFALMLTVFVLGLFVGTNMGVLLICLMRMAGRNRVDEPEMAAVALPMEQ